MRLIMLMTVSVPLLAAPFAGGSFTSTGGGWLQSLGDIVPLLMMLFSFPVTLISLFALFRYKSFQKEHYIRERDKANQTMENLRKTEVFSIEENPEYMKIRNKIAHLKKIIGGTNNHENTN